MKNSPKSAVVDGYIGDGPSEDLPMLPHTSTSVIHFRCILACSKITQATERKHNANGIQYRD